MLENIKLIKSNFLSCVPVKQINFGDVLEHLKDWQLQETFVDEIMLCEQNVKYPVRQDYQLAFIKHVIQQLEAKQVSEIHDKFYELLAEKVKQSEEFSYKHFKIGAKYISMKESNSFIRDGTTGLKMWPATITLCNYIIENPHIFEKKSVLELGSGCNPLTAEVLISCNANQIFLSDCHDLVLGNLAKNVELNLGDCKENLETSLFMREHWMVNNKSCELGILNLAWEDVDEYKEELSQKCHIDIILAADIIYDSSNFNSLVKCLNKLFRTYNDSIQFILSQTIRNNDTFSMFCELLKENSFHASEILLHNLKCTISDPNGPSNDVRMFHITKLRK